jgi:hypothetical protein
MAWIIRALASLLLSIPIGAIIKMAIGSFGVLVLPKILKYFYLQWGDDLLSSALTYIAGTDLNYNGLVVELSGFAGYMAQKMRFVDMLTVIISTYITLFFLGFFRK